MEKICIIYDSKHNMNTEKLERGNILAKSLIPKVDVLLSMSPKVSSGELADAFVL